MEVSPPASIERKIPIIINNFVTIIFVFTKRNLIKGKCVIFRRSIEFSIEFVEVLIENGNMEKVLKLKINISS